MNQNVAISCPATDCGCAPSVSGCRVKRCGGCGCEKPDKLVGRGRLDLSQEAFCVRKRRIRNRRSCEARQTLSNRLPELCLHRNCKRKFFTSWHNDGHGDQKSTRLSLCPAELKAVSRRKGRDTPPVDSCTWIEWPYLSALVISTQNRRPHFLNHVQYYLLSHLSESCIHPRHG